MKIVFAVDAYHPRLNGVTTFVDASLKYLASRSHEVFLLCPGGYPQEDLYPGPLAGIAEVHRFASYPIWYSTNKEDRQIYPWEQPRIHKVLRSIEPDLIHVQTEFDVGQGAKRYALKHNIPVVASAHTYFLPYAYVYFPYLPRWFLNWLVPHLSRRAFRDVDLILTPTTAMKDILEKDLNITTPMRTSFIGIDTTDFNGIDRENERYNSFYFGMFPRWRGRKRLLFVGRLSEEKNISFLLRAFERILAVKPNTELILVGAGSALEYYQQEVDGLDMVSHVTFTGPIPHNKLKNIYAIADIFTFPSLTEAQGLVTCEALYSGVPVVGMDALGTKIVMTGGKGGYLVDNLEDFVAKTLLLLSDNKLYTTKRQEAFKRGAEMAFEQTGRELEQAYVDAIAWHRESKPSTKA